MLDDVDVDGSGTLSFSEFLIFMRTLVSPEHDTRVGILNSIPVWLFSNNIKELSRKVREQEVQRLEAGLMRFVFPHMPSTHYVQC